MSAVIQSVKTSFLKQSRLKFHRGLELEPNSSREKKEKEDNSPTTAMDRRIPVQLHTLDTDSIQPVELGIIIAAHAPSLSKGSFGKLQPRFPWDYGADEEES